MSIVGGVQARLATVPTVPFTETGGSYDLSDVKQIIVDSRYVNTIDHQGQTLIPPTLHEFAETFQSDLNEIFGVEVQVSSGSTRKPNSIFLTLGNNTDFVNAAGSYTSESYELTVDSHGPVITGASPLGVWWATRSIIQLATVGDLKIPKGSAVDAPGWGSRGVMVSLIDFVWFFL